MNDLQERKRQLLAHSEIYRQSMQSQLHELKTATAWIPKTARMARSVYPIVVLCAPLLGYTFARKRGTRPAEPSRRRGIFARALTGLKLFRSIKPLWDGLRSWKHSNGE